jgi:hypothetical protein
MKDETSRPDGHQPVRPDGRWSALSRDTLKAHRARWFVYAGEPRKKLPHTKTMRGHWPAWDVTCSCGWESRTGGATKTSVADDLREHRFESQSAARAVREPAGNPAGTCTCCRKNITLMYGALWTADDGTTGCKYSAGTYAPHEPGDLTTTSPDHHPASNRHDQPQASSSPAPDTTIASTTPGCDSGETVRVSVRWSEVTTFQAARDLDAARMRRLGYDPHDPQSITRYLHDADDFDGDDWYPWHTEFSGYSKRAEAGEAEIISVTIKP